MPSMDSTKAIVTEMHSDAMVVFFNRPEMRSPLSVVVVEELKSIIERIESDSLVRRIVFTGRDDVFASGADIREISAVTAEEAREFGERGQELMRMIASSRKVTVAAVNGFCFGGALDLALSCKHRIASPSASFCHPGVSLGIITGWGGTQRLPRLIGEAAALEMLLTAKRVEAKEALEMGLIDEIAEGPLARALEM